MPLPTIPGTVRCSVRGSAPSGEEWVNVVHCRYAGGASNPGPTEIAALDAKLVRFWSGTAYTSGQAWLTRCRNNWAMADITYYPLDNSSLATVVSHVVAGTDPTTTSSPPEVAPVLTIRTANRGRRYRGRIFLPAPTTALVNADGTLQAGVITQTVNQMIGLQADLATIQWALGVASYGVGQSTNPVTKVVTSTTWSPFFTPATTFSMDPKFDVQRRRK